MEAGPLAPRVIRCDAHASRGRWPRLHQCAQNRRYHFPSGLRPPSPVFCPPPSLFACSAVSSPTSATSGPTAGTLTAADVLRPALWGDQRSRRADPDQVRLPGRSSTRRADTRCRRATVILIAATVPMLFLLRAVSGFLNSYYVQLTGVRILEAVRLDYLPQAPVAAAFLHPKGSQRRPAVARHRRHRATAVQP